MVRRSVRVDDEADTLPALTVLQPFATALVDAAPESKWCENRTWRREYPAGGLWCAIHAGAGHYWPVADEARELRRLAQMTGWSAGRTYPRGAIVGLVRFVSCVSAQGRPGDRWAVGPWCHVIDRAFPLVDPLLGVKGKLGFWRLDPETSAALRGLIPLEVR